MNVSILATCRKPELLDYTTLVFKTIRVGFPTANIRVDGNELPDYAFEAVKIACEQSGCEFWNGIHGIHHQWVEGECRDKKEPFVLCDTDMIFFDEVESWKFDTSLAGWRIPEWRDDFSGCVTRARLHTSLLFVDPVKLREDISKFYANVFESEFTPRANLFHPLVVPFKKTPLFYDTCSMLYHAIGGTAFTEQQLDALFHFNFGSISDIVLPRLPRQDQDNFRLARAAILQNRSRGKGMWRSQQNWYLSHPV